MEERTVKEFAYMTEKILEAIDNAIRHNNMEFFQREYKSANSDSYIAHIDVIDAYAKKNNNESKADRQYRQNLEELELHYEDKTSVVYDMRRTVEELVSQIQKLEEINIEIERLETEQAELDYERGGE